MVSPDSRAQDVAEQLRSAVAAALPRLSALAESASDVPRAPGKWSRKQILGHLIDSALNNHQRFVRAQLEDRLALPGYAQDGWVAVQRYAERPWSELVQLWTDLNQHLAHVMAAVPDDRLATPCVIGDDEAVTLGWLMSDYLRHLEHHLAQIEEQATNTARG